LVKNDKMFKISTRWWRSSSAWASLLSAEPISLELEEELRPPNHPRCLSLFAGDDQTLRRSPRLLLRQPLARVSRQTVGSSRVPEFRLTRVQVSSVADPRKAFVVSVLVVVVAVVVVAVVVGEEAWRWRSVFWSASCWRLRWWKTVGPVNTDLCLILHDDPKWIRLY